ncbi:MAG TPA: hypothetical protein VI547_14995 [Anaerolineales bacterium]|nr:hypothetical protein [Anaerolineales bacterium]
MKRIAIVGKTGSGKTTLAREIARRIDAPHIELDSISWGPNWKSIAWERFRAHVEARTREPLWITDGNYRQAREFVWGRADTLVWLDYPLWVALWRLTVRTARRVWTREVLWGTNVERGSAILGRDSLYWYAIKKHREHRIEYPLAFRQPEYCHLKIVYLRSPRETAAWLEPVGDRAGSVKNRAESAQ